jgi:DNA-binding transcriptional LysR family regulator
VAREQQLGLRLFHRTTPGAPDAGRHLFHERCRRILDELHDARAAMQAAAEAPRAGCA